MKDRKLFTRAITVAAASAAAGLILRSEYEKNHFVTESTEIASAKLRREHLFVFITDLHDHEFGPDNAGLINAVQNLGPDAIFIGGDTMIAKPSKASLRVTALLLDAFSAIAPVYYANGNHEQRLEKEDFNYPQTYEIFCALLKQCGVHYLNDSSEFIDDDIRISGLNIDEIYYKGPSVPDMTVSEITRHLGIAGKDRYQILLAHSPLFFDAYASWGADLTLAGHFHGGTVRLPVLGGLMTPQYQFFSPYCAGTFQCENNFMLVSRGLGTHTVNVRLANRPQICVLELHPVY